MNLRRIKYFLKVCECKSMKQAAKAMYLETATLSRAITELEREVLYRLL